MYLSSIILETKSFSIEIVSRPTIMTVEIFVNFPQKLYFNGNLTSKTQNQHFSKLGFATDEQGQNFRVINPENSNICCFLCNFIKIFN